MVSITVKVSDRARARQKEYVLHIVCVWMDGWRADCFSPVFGTIVANKHALGSIRCADYDGVFDCSLSHSHHSTVLMLQLSSSLSIQLICNSINIPTFHSFSPSHIGQHLSVCMCVCEPNIFICNRMPCIRICCVSCVCLSNFSDIVVFICLHTMAMVYERLILLFPIYGNIV